VDHDSRLIVENHLRSNPNDKQERQPALDNLSQLPEELGQVDQALADNGFFSEANVKVCEQAGIIPLLATGRAGHHPTLEERFADPGEAPDTADPVARMEHRLPTPEGKALYAKRQSTVEPVFGIIKHVMVVSLSFHDEPQANKGTISQDWGILPNTAVRLDTITVPR
jgi:hypothetical protein